MSDTPITDAGVRSGRLQSADGWLTKDSSDWVLAERARYLERELTAAQQEIKRLTATIAAKGEAIKRLNGWLDNDRRALGEEG